MRSTSFTIPLVADPDVTDESHPSTRRILPTPCPSGKDTQQVVVLPSIPGYEVIGELRSGGFAVVYAAIHEVSGRAVAIKILRPDVNAVVAVQERFKLEAKFTDNLTHPHIVPVYDCFPLSDGRLCLVMRRLFGSTLDQLFEAEWRWADGDEPLQESAVATEFMEVFGQVCSAVAFSHKKGVIHRDIKPDNILVDTLLGRPHAFLIDFGVGSVRGDSDLRASAPVDWLPPFNLTREGSLVGTPFYFAPESVQSRGRVVTEQLDLFGLGLLLYEFLGGQHPFDKRKGNDDARRILSWVATGDYPPLAELIPRVPESFVRVVSRALELDPAKRHHGAMHLWTAVKEAWGPTKVPWAIDENT